jgi:hypothetical protein
MEESNPRILGDCFLLLPWGDEWENDEEKNEREEKVPFSSVPFCIFDGQGQHIRVEGGNGGGQGTNDGDKVRQKSPAEIELPAVPARRTKCNCAREAIWQIDNPQYGLKCTKQYPPFVIHSSIFCLNMCWHPGQFASGPFSSNTVIPL